MVGGWAGVGRGDPAALEFALMKPLYWAILLLALGLLVWLISRRQRKRTGLPGGALVYSDSGYMQAVPKPLYDPELELVGKPDYLLRIDQGVVVPVELKSGRAPNFPWDSHVVQLAAYCHLVERNFGDRPPYGLIQYQDKSFRLPYTEEQEQRLRALVNEMRQAERRMTANRSHQSAARCRGCGFSQMCDQRILS